LCKAISPIRAAKSVRAFTDRKRRAISAETRRFVSPFETFPMSFYGNYGRGIASQDARGVVRNPDAPKISTTDFYQTGTSYNSRRVSAVFSFFLIDRSNEQVYIPDDGSSNSPDARALTVLKQKTSVRFNRYLSFNGGLTQVLRAFYPGEFFDDANNSRRRVIVDSAPHTVANGSFVLSELRGFNSSLNWRHISSYRLDGEDDSIRAAGHDVVDFSLSKRLKKWVDLIFRLIICSTKNITKRKIISNRALRRRRCHFQNSRDARLSVYGNVSV
jgi:hypothetical protein